MSLNEIKKSRVLLRRIDAHLRHAHQSAGATETSVGFVDVVIHPTNVLPELNYVTPRQNTAWVSSNHIEQGLIQLREQQRAARVRYIEGLFPPIFERTLHDIELEIEREIPMMAFQPSSELRRVTDARREITVTRATDADSLAIWWYVWRNAHYDVFTGGAEPLVIGRDLPQIYTHQQINLIFYQRQHPVGVARLTRFQKSAHLAAIALLKDLEKAEWYLYCAQLAVDAALAEGCDLVFLTDPHMENREPLRRLQFVDVGSLLSFVQTSKTAPDGEESVAVEPSVMVI